MGASKDAMDEEGNAAADLGLVARIRESFDSLTATEREAAQFILGHLTDVLVCNSVELSQLSGISQPTLSRLYRKLGYSNAGEFRRDVRRVHRPGAPEIPAKVRCDDLVADHLLRDSESLKHTFEDIDRAQLDPHAGTWPWLRMSRWSVTAMDIPWRFICVNNCCSCVETSIFCRIRGNLSQRN